MSTFKTLFSFCAVITVLTSCEDFTQRNLDQGLNNQNQGEEISEVDLLLSEASEINKGNFSLNKLTANIGANTVQPLVETFKSIVLLFDSAYQQHCNYIDVTTSLNKAQLEQLRKPLQEKWIETMLTYHKLSVMDFGPSNKTTSAFNEAVYTFDGEEKCRVDQILYRLDGGPRSQLPRLDVTDNYNVRGLDAIEPLLFADSKTTRCSRPNPRLTKWFEDTPLIDVEKRTCVFVKHLLTDIVEKTNVLAKEWAPNKGHFTSQMLKGKAGAPLEVINEISQGLFFLDTDTKDPRLAYPAGFDVEINDVVQSCPEADCPGKREHPYANIGIKAIIAQVEGFKSVFLGLNEETKFNGFGFDDLLKDRDHGDIATSISQNLEKIISNLQAFDQNNDFKAALENIDRDKCEATTSDNRLEEVCALVWDLRSVTSVMKNEYITALKELSLPTTAQGDSD